MHRVGRARHDQRAVRIGDDGDAAAVHPGAHVGTPRAVEAIVEHQHPCGVAGGRRGMDHVDVDALLAQQQHQAAGAVGPAGLGVERRRARPGAARAA